MRKLLFLMTLPLLGKDPEIEALDLAPGRESLDIYFTENRDIAVGGAGMCNITNLQALQKGPSAVSPGITTLITISLTGPLVAGTKIAVLCDSVGFVDGTKTMIVKNLTATFNVPTSKDYATLLLQNIDKEIKAAKKSSEKNIFASGFVTTASGVSAGGGDISLNPDLKIPNLKPFLQIKKTTQAGGDAKHFEAGARYQKFFITNRKAFESIRGMGTAELVDVLAKFKETKPGLYDRTFAGSSADIAFKMEGAAGKFDVTNFVGDSAYTMRTKTLGFLDRQGFFRAFLTPFAFEGGQSHANQDAALAGGKPVPKPDWIARYKSGLGFRLHFADAKGKFPIQRVELSGDGVFRDLLYQESMWDAKAKLVNQTGKGIRAYGQIDLKVYVGQSETAFYGLKLSYNRGSLPPVFARVKSFQFGFLYESKE